VDEKAEHGPALEWSGGADDAAIAVVAHGLLNSISAIQLGAHALRESWDKLDDAQRRQVIDVLVDQSAHVRGVLQDLIRGLPAEVIRALNSLDPDDGDDATGSAAET
jgi:hypothetical protein